MCNVYLDLKGARLLRAVYGPGHPLQFFCAVLARLNMGLDHALSYTLWAEGNNFEVASHSNSNAARWSQRRSELTYFVKRTGIRQRVEDGMREESRVVQQLVLVLDALVAVCKV